jgi:hypothetical protein
METDERKDRDVRAIRGLIDGTAVNAEMEPWCWRFLALSTRNGVEMCGERVSSKARDTLQPLTSPLRSGGQVSLMPHLPHPLGVIGDTISRCVRYLSKSCNSYSHSENEEVRRRRMRVCVEATAPHVCCIDFRLLGFGEVGKLVNEISHIEKVNELQINPSYSTFTVHWTGLSLMEIQRNLRSNRLQGLRLAGYVVSGLACLQSPNPVHPTRRHMQALIASTNISGPHGSTLRNYIERSSPGARRRPRNRSRKSYENTIHGF